MAIPTTVAPAQATERALKALSATEESVDIVGRWKAGREKTRDQQVTRRATPYRDVVVLRLLPMLRQR